MQNSLIQIRIALAILCVVIAASLFAQTNIVDVSTVKLSDQIEHDLSQFETNKSVESLKAAITKLKNPEPHIDRKQQASLWFRLLAAIDQNMDSSFSPTNANISANLIPPSDGGVQYASGVDPQVIKDPVARSQYVADLKANKEKAQNYSVQVNLQRINKQIGVDFERFLKSTYTSSEPDQKELDEMIRQSKLSPIRKDQINNFKRRPVN